MAQVVPAVAVNQNAPDTPVPTILARLNEHAPILPRNASATDIVIHRLRMVNVCNEYACSEYVIGPLPTNLDPQSVQLGTYLLSRTLICVVSLLPRAAMDLYVGPMLATTCWEAEMSRKS